MIQNQKPVRWGGNPNRSRAGIYRRVALGVAVLLVDAYMGISYFIASGVTRAEREDFEDHPTDYGLEYEDVEFVSRKGDVTLMGWYLPSPRCEASLILVHGISSNRASREATRIAAHLIEACFNVLLFDLRAHGASGGDRITGGIDEAEDVLGAYDYLQSRGAEPHRVGVLGRSMGAGAAVLAAAAEPDIRALVLDSTYAQVHDLITFEIARKTPVPEWVAPVFIPGATLLANVLYGIDLSKLAPEHTIKSVDVPILVIHGKADTHIPTEHGIRVHEAAHSESEIWIVPGSDHGQAFHSFPDDYVERVVSYFRTHLSGEATP